MGVNTAISLPGIASSHHLNNIYLCTHWKMLLLSIFREASFCSEWWMQNSWLHKALQISDYWGLSLKQDIYIAPSKTRGTFQKRAKKECKSQMIGRQAEKVIAWEDQSVGEDSCCTVLRSLAEANVHWASCDIALLSPVTLCDHLILFLWPLLFVSLAFT